MLGGGDTRSGVMTVVYGAIVFAIVMVFIVQFRPGSGRTTASLTQQCAITVGDRCVEPKEFLASLSLAVPRSADSSNMSDIRRVVAEGIIERILLVEDARRLGITVSDTEIDFELRRGRFRVTIPYTYRHVARYLGLTEPGAEGVRVYQDISLRGSGAKGASANDKSGDGTGFNYKEYTRTIRTITNRSPTEFRAMQRDEIIAQRMRELIAARASVTDSEAMESYRSEKNSAILSYVRLDKNYFAAKYVDTSPKSVDAWASSHLEDVEGSWAARKASFPAGCVKVRHILVRAKNDTMPVGHDRDEAQALVEKARERLSKGEPFAIVAAEMSEDYRSAATGGDLGCLTKGNLPPTISALEDAVFAQSKAGLVDTIVDSPYGFHLVDIDTVLSSDEQQAEVQARALVTRELMLANETERLVRESAERIQQAVQSGTDLAEAVESELVRLEEGRGLRKKGAKPDKSEPQQEDPGRPQVETTASFSPISGPPIDGVDPGVNVVDLAFRLGKPGDVGKDLVRLTNGYAVIQLKDRHLVTSEEFERDRYDYISFMRAAKQHDMVVGYVEQLRKDTKKQITISERWIQDPKRQGQDSD